MKKLIKYPSGKRDPVYRIPESVTVVDYYAFKANVFLVRAVFPSGVSVIPTGLFIELPAGYEAQIRPRSGLALKRGLTVLNTPGTIDADYRGEVGVILINLSGEAQTIEPGERICQMVIARHETPEVVEVQELSDTERGAGGFGHSGRK